MEPYLPPEAGVDEDWFADEPALRAFLARRLPPAAFKELESRLVSLGTQAPRLVDPLAREADADRPRLDGNEVVLGPSYRGLQDLARKHQVFTLAWHPLGDMPHGTRVATFALGYLFAQAESGYYCPACMTDGAAYVLQRHAPQLAARYVPRLVQMEAAGAYEGAMFLTEKTGGSDVGATTTIASSAKDDTWRLTGDKWFASNANAEIILTLARMPGASEGTRGLGLFVVPAHLPDGTANAGLHRIKLKEKLGVRSMATAEVELRNAYAELVCAEGDGFKAMAEMVNLSRLYNAVASIAIARRAVRIGARNGVARHAFGRPLARHPLYARAVAELANDVRGALMVTLDTADAFDRAAAGDTEAYRLLRALTPLAKAQTARLAVDAASAACEFLGGNGYIEEWVTPRLLRDAQVLPIWEGTTNVQALDFLRACIKDRAHEALAADSLARVSDDGLAEAWRAWVADIDETRSPEAREIAALRLLERGYHLRAATVLASEAAADPDPVADTHARAYALRHVENDPEAWEAFVLLEASALAGWPSTVDR